LLVPGVGAREEVYLKFVNTEWMPMWDYWLILQGNYLHASNGTDFAEKGRAEAVENATWKGNS
jgi:hypothetical protein